MLSNIEYKLYLFPLSVCFFMILSLPSAVQSTVHKLWILISLSRFLCVWHWFWWWGLLRVCASCPRGGGGGGRSLWCHSGTLPVLLCAGLWLPGPLLTDLSLYPGRKQRKITNIQNNSYFIIILSKQILKLNYRSGLVGQKIELYQNKLA